MNTATGWLLDVYASPGEGAALWLLEDDGSEQGGRRLRLTQPLAVSFYAAGPNERLRALWQWLQRRDEAVTLERTERRDLFAPQPLTVLAVTVNDAASQPRLFARVSTAFPDLTFYDADIALPLRHAAAFGTFPLAKLTVDYDTSGKVNAIRVLDSPWELDPPPAPVKILSLEPDCPPTHAPPSEIRLSCGRAMYTLPLQPARPLLINLAAILRRHDPDLLLSNWGDTWLLPHLLALSEKLALPLPLNRDERRGALHRPERSYQAYGQVIYRGRQVQLFGRWHVDRMNAVMFRDYGLAGVLESARVSGLPVQQAARLSPGTGISAMQIVTALRLGVLTPWRKQQAESPKSALELIHADQGGLVYQPIVGVHGEVAEVDFVSMYPGIMARFNVSPETVGTNFEFRISNCELVPELDLWVDMERPGLVPQTLRPLLAKRVALKQRAARLPRWDPRRETDKARAAAHKWLLVTCFGYLGYKNARFGRIEAHQAVTAFSRECLLRAKEAAEDAGFTVLHMYVDGLWVQKDGAAGEVQFLLDEIAARTGLPVALEGIYRWVVFLPSRVDGRTPVANRYFGVFGDGSLKVRGIEARRRDTPPFVARAQMAILQQLAAAQRLGEVAGQLPAAARLLRREMRRLREGRVPLEELLATQKVSRELALYRTPSPAARAAMQLAAAGKSVRPGMAVRFLYVRGEAGVHAWDCPPPPPVKQVDVAVYGKLLLRAAASVLQPWAGGGQRECESWAGLENKLRAGEFAEGG